MRQMSVVEWHYPAVLQTNATTVANVVYGDNLAVGGVERLAVRGGHDERIYFAADRRSTRRPLLRAADVQAQLGMSRAKVYRLMQHNILPTVRIGGSVRVPRKALFKWIQENTLPGQRVTY